MNLNRLLIAVIVSSIFTSGLYFFAEPKPPAKLPVLGSTTPINSYTISHSIDFSGLSPNQQANISATPSDSVFSLLSKYYPVTTHQEKLGLVVDTINSVKGRTSSQKWVYSLNGQSISLPPDRLLIQPHDVIEWKLSPSK